MKYFSNRIVEELNGYLRCISRLTETRSSFGAMAYEANINVDFFGIELSQKWSLSTEHFEAPLLLYKGSEIIAYNALEAEILSYLTENFILESQSE